VTRLNVSQRAGRGLGRLARSKSLTPRRREIISLTSGRTIL